MVVYVVCTQRDALKAPAAINLTPGLMCSFNLHQSEAHDMNSQYKYTQGSFYTCNPKFLMAVELEQKISV